MGNLRARPPANYESSGSHPEKDEFTVQCAGRGGSVDRAFNYTSPKMVKEVNNITNVSFSRRKPLK